MTGIGRDAPARVLTVSGAVPSDLADQIAAGRRPRPDYLVIAEHLHAELLDRPAVAARAGRVERAVRRVGGENVAMAWALARWARSSEVVVTDGEQIGIPYAALTRWRRRRPRHVMIAHYLTPRKKVVPYRLLGLRRAVDRVIAYATPQADLAVATLGHDRSDVVRMPFMVDTAFWRPDHHPTADAPGPSARPLICAAGLEFRDYPTLVEAVRDLDVDVVIAAASPWSKRSDSSAGVELPAHVTVRGFDLHALRDLYARADIVTVPLVESDFQAGITTILEAMAMGKAIVCTRTSGQTDTIVDGVTGRYVPPGDAATLRSVLAELVAEPAQRVALGAAARHWVVDHADVEVYARRVASVATHDGGTGEASGPFDPGQH